jgi:transcriptional regulator with XRE-family HTH domain
MLIGDIIAELRHDVNMHQKDLAKILNVSVATISHYESGINCPDLNTIVAIADYFMVSVDYLLGRTRLMMDYDTFKRKVKLPDGSTISVDDVLSEFIQLSDQSQVEIINLIHLYLFRDKVRHGKLKQPIKLNYDRITEKTQRITG